MTEMSDMDVLVVANESRRVRLMAQEVAKGLPSRELSLAVTKLEEAEMWAMRAACLAPRPPWTGGVPAGPERDALIAACRTPAFHETHRYCPSCPWTESADGGRA